jgi:predicted ATP-binding protein involved in virulence
LSQIARIRLSNFTAFEQFDHTFSPGLTVVTGTNGTGKTHLLKVMYSACAITNGEDREYSFAQKLTNVFRPYGDRIGRLARRQATSVTSSVLIETRDGRSLTYKFSNHTAEATNVRSSMQAAWKARQIVSAFIPVKEMLAHAPGFVATTARRELAFEDVYPDIIKLAYLPRLKGPAKQDRKQLLGKLEKAVDGKVITKGEHFFLKSAQGELEFSLLAEGMRKLALIWLLIQNGTLLGGSILFWDEPEANLNPKLMEQLVDVMLELQRNGVQIILTTHNNVLLRYIDLKRKKTDAVEFLNLVNTEKGVVTNKSRALRDLNHLAISEAIDNMFDSEIKSAISLGL